MDNKALAEQMTDLYLNIGAYYETKMSAMPTSDQVNTIFIECSKMIMTETIGKQRQGVPAQRESKSKSDQQCNRCGKWLTDGELKYIEDTDSERICYKCSH